MSTGAAVEPEWSAGPVSDDIPLLAGLISGGIMGALMAGPVGLLIGGILGMIIGVAVGERLEMRKRGS